MGEADAGGPTDRRLAPIVRALPAAPGVYRFREASGAVLYIGRAAHLRERVASYWSDLGDRRHLLRMVAAVRGIEAVACASRHEAAWLERNLLEEALPPWNKTPGGQETPVSIALDPRPAAPGLRVLHEGDAVAAGVHVFGPYLGGLQVRRAVNGLERILPLALTGSRLGGTERALAAERGVAERDRDTLAAALTAVLRREPAAMAAARHELERLREAAAAAAAFELAARIHAELQAVDWIASPQRVTVTGGGDADVHGWAGGVLVSFGIRDGRLRSWRQRPISHAGAAPHVAATPPEWRDFARGNAELAAALVAAQRPSVARRATPP